MNYFIGILQVLASGIGFGFLGIFARLSQQQGLSIGELLSLRFALASLILWCYMLIFRRPLIRLGIRQVLISAALGACGYAVFSTLYFKSIEGISVPLAAMLLFTFPLFVNLGAHFILKEKMSRLQFSCLLIASTGLVLLLWGDISVQKVTAIFFGLGAGLSYAIYVLVSGRYQTNVRPLSSTLYVISAAAISLCLFHQPDANHLLHLSLDAWLLVIGIALVSTIAPIALFLAGLQKMKSSKASIIVMIEPVTASIAAFYILHESLGQLQIAGGALVLTAVSIDASFKAS